jgi:hypothetical protein
MLLSETVNFGMGGRSQLEKEMLGISYVVRDLGEGRWNARGRAGSISYAALRLRCYEKAPASGAARAATSRSARRLAALGLVQRHRGGITITKKGEALVEERLMRPVLHDGLASTIRKVQQSKQIDDETMHFAAAFLLLASRSDKLQISQIFAENLFSALKRTLSR